MSKMHEIVTDALREVGIVAEGDDATADQMAHGLRALNRMMASWSLHGIDNFRGDMTGAEDFPMFPEFQEGVIYNLAARLSTAYQLPIGFNPDDWFRIIQARYAIVDDAEMPDALLRAPSQYWPRTRLR